MIISSSVSNTFTTEYSHCLSLEWKSLLTEPQKVRATNSFCLQMDLILFYETLALIRTEELLLTVFAVQHQVVTTKAFERKIMNILL